MISALSLLIPRQGHLCVAQEEGSAELSRLAVLRGLLFRMFGRGVQVIHLLNIERLAAEYYLPNAPASLSADLDYQRAWRERTMLVGLVVLAWLALAVLFLILEKD